MKATRLICAAAVLAAVPLNAAEFKRICIHGDSLQVEKAIPGAIEPSHRIGGTQVDTKGTQVFWVHYSIPVGVGANVRQVWYRLMRSDDKIRVDKIRLYSAERMVQEIAAPQLTADRTWTSLTTLTDGTFFYSSFAASLRVVVQASSATEAHWLAFSQLCADIGGPNN